MAPLPAAVHHELLGGNLYLEKATQVARYREPLAHAWTRSIPLEEAHYRQERRTTGKTCHGDAVLIFKILLPSEWAEFETAGQFQGSAFDRSSGFIHCSSREQVAGTALRVFSDEPALVLVALDAELLSEWLRWEPAPNGGPFPHVYASLPLSAVMAVHHIPGAAAVDDLLPSNR